MGDFLFDAIAFTQAQGVSEQKEGAQRDQQEQDGPGSGAGLR
jgi:hypothetical protein